MAAHLTFRNAWPISKVAKLSKEEYGPEPEVWFTKKFGKVLTYSLLEASYERVFSKLSKRARYCGIAKNQFQIFMQAFAHTMKRLIVLNIPEIRLVPIAG